MCVCVCALHILLPGVCFTGSWKIHNSISSRTQCISIISLASLMTGNIRSFPSRVLIRMYSSMYSVIIFLQGLFFLLLVIRGVPEIEVEIVGVVPHGLLRLLLLWERGPGSWTHGWLVRELVRGALHGEDVRHAPKTNEKEKASSCRLFCPNLIVNLTKMFTSGSHSYLMTYFQQSWDCDPNSSPFCKTSSMEMRSLRLYLALPLPPPPPPPLDPALWDLVFRARSVSI